MLFDEAQMKELKMDANNNPVVDPNSPMMVAKNPQSVWFE